MTPTIHFNKHGPINQYQQIEYKYLKTLAMQKNTLHTLTLLLNSMHTSYSKLLAKMSHLKTLLKKLSKNHTNKSAKKNVQLTEQENIQSV